MATMHIHAEEGLASEESPSLKNSEENLLLAGVVISPLSFCLDCQPWTANPA
jgi:hypothetical protein